MHKRSNGKINNKENQFSIKEIHRRIKNGFLKTTVSPLHDIDFYAFFFTDRKTDKEKEKMFFWKTENYFTLSSCLSEIKEKEKRKNQ